VREIQAAIEWMAREELQLLSSTGLQTWEMLTAVAVDAGLSIRMFLPTTSTVNFDSQCDEVAAEFGMRPDRTEYVPVIVEKNEARADRLARRDQMIIAQADLLLPISVSQSGNMAGYLKKAVEQKRLIERRFQIATVEPGAMLKLGLDGQELSSDVLGLDDEYLIHWTRATNSSWPGEKKIIFYRDVMQSAAWPRSGMHTLERIVETKMLLASGRHMPEKCATVSWSSLSPVEVVPLMRWRSRYREMSFEPYGIGITREGAARLGIRPVTYHDAEGRDVSVSDESWLTQSVGMISDWRAEKEFRHRGNLSLAGIADEEIALFCMTGAEAERLRQNYPYRVFSFLE
jgi:hypothetical protein